MKKNNSLPPELIIDENENPLYYKIEHQIAVNIWRVLFESGNEKTAECCLPP